MDVYLDELANLDNITLRAALQRYGQGGRSFFPTVPEILKAVSDIEAVRSNQPTALDAWGALRTKIRRINLDILERQPESEAARLGITPLESLIVQRMGGWEHLVLTEPKNLHFKAREFQAFHDDLSARRQVEDTLLSIAPAKDDRALLGEGD